MFKGYSSHRRAAHMADRDLTVLDGAQVPDKERHPVGEDLKAAV